MPGDKVAEAGARVAVVSPRMSPVLLALAADGRFAWWPREYAAGDTAGFFLVLVATDDRTVNAQVAALPAGPAAPGHRSRAKGASAARPSPSASV